MALVPLYLDIEEIAFIPVLRVLKGLPGIANVHFDLDMLGKKRGGQHKSNGHVAEPKSNRIGLKAVVLKSLHEKPRTVTEMAEVARHAGYPRKGSVSSCLTDLNKQTLVVGKLGTWSLTPKGRSFLEAADGEFTERRALPPPAPEPPPEAKEQDRKKRSFTVTGPVVIVATLQREGKPMSRLELQKYTVAKGFAGSGIDGAVAKAKSLGWIENEGPGVVKLTKEGRKYKPAPEAFPTAQ